MYPPAVFGPPGHTHKYLKTGGKKEYPKVNFTQIGAKVKKEEKGDFGKFPRKRRKRENLRGGRKKENPFLKGGCGNTGITILKKSQYKL